MRSFGEQKRNFDYIPASVSLGRVSMDVGSRWPCAIFRERETTFKGVPVVDEVTASNGDRRGVRPAGVIMPAVYFANNLWGLG